MLRQQQKCSKCGNNPQLMTLSPTDDDLYSNQTQPTLLNRLNLVLTPARYATLNYQYPTDCGESLLDIWKLKTHIPSWCVKLIIEYPLLMGQ